VRIEEIKKLIELVEQSAIGELEVRRWWGSVRIAKAPRGGAPLVTFTPPVAATAGEDPPPAPAASEPVASAAPDAPAAGEVTIASPMVGTVYRASSPTAEPFVKVGSHVAAGQVVCIVEAMKLMNEIEAELSGTVTKILVENGQPVEFNQALFHLRPDS
jgi:acetyl-CoA carboxylase biotin carboxyl carrier protein